MAFESPDGMSSTESVGFYPRWEILLKVFLRELYYCPYLLSLFTM
ncbi:hypothetical protein LEP1GSC083_5111 [Leptospira interrogans serovar Pyrogenes str. L0374]|uniref:Uncharacterized protein n=1 Tax=Leptospira interrogans serovar Pyrogenes str. L0374 TaxID=1049928 RepID=M6K215_LEPIR|nr:hypothetical protein LEP1GSC083_5111 [Leptospira interrogans serovar Pyrogenes str. L0374]